MPNEAQPFVPMGQDPHDEGEITPEMVREIVAPMLLEGEQLTETDIDIIIKVALQNLESGHDIENSVLEAVDARFEARRKVETNPVEYVIDSRGDVVGTAGSDEEVRNIIANERENEDRQPQL